VHPDVRKLLEVQKVDQEIARLRRDLNSIPAEQERRSRRLAQLRSQSENAQRALQAAEMESREMELGIKHADEEIAKLRVRLNTVKNNAEYQATLLQTESVKTERSRLEERGLELLEQVESLRIAAGVARQALAAEEKVFAEFRKEAECLEQERAAAIERVSIGREKLLDGIPAELLERYEDLFEVRGGSAVCSVEGQVCTGCYTSVTMNDIANLMGRSQVVQCGSCQRILYYLPPGT
jgi:hypothetical protein